jgi:chemotaxis protein methyltransferase CheR
MTGLPLTAFKELIGRRCGLAFAGRAEENLAQAVVHRTAARGLSGAAAYYTLLLADAAELQELVQLLTVNETYFFREAEQLALLTDRLMPRLLAAREPGCPVRILSAGCSTGEEPYSIAIALLERFGGAAGSLFTILAGDIDQPALAHAQAARYGAYSFRGVADDLKRRWFERDGELLTVDPRARAMVRFQPLNLIAPEFPPELEQFDVVFFRNVSIYFDADTRRIIQGNLLERMADPAYLVVASSETLANDFGLMPLVEDGGRFYFARGPVPATALSREVRACPGHPRDAAKPPSPPEQRRIDVAGRDKPGHDAKGPDGRQRTATLADARDLLRGKRYGEAAALLARLRAERPGDAGPLLLEGWRHLQQREPAEARRLGEAALERDPWSAEGEVLLGFVARHDHDRDEALRRFKRAAYSRYDCWPVHYYLGELLRAGGDGPAAQRAYRIALHQLTSRPDPDGGLLLPLDLPPAEVRLLCARLSGDGAAG